MQPSTSRKHEARPGERPPREIGPVVEHTELNRPTRFLANMRFRVDVPEVRRPSQRRHKGNGELAKFELTQEEKIGPTEILLPPFLGFEFGSNAAERYAYDQRPPSPNAIDGLSDPDSLDTQPSLDSFDYELIDAVESVTERNWTLDKDTAQMVPRKKRTLPVPLKHVNPERWWIKSQEAERKSIIPPLQFRRPNRKRKFRVFASKEAYIRSVMKGFEKAKNPPETRPAQITSSFQSGRPTTTQTKARKAVAVYNVMPYEDRNGRPFCTVNFHNNCVDDSERLIPYSQDYRTQIPENVLLKELYVEPKSLQEAEVNRAMGFDNKYLGLMAPCHVHTSTDRCEAVMDGNEEYLWIREYDYTKKIGKEQGKWRWAVRLNREKKEAQLVPIEQRFVTKKQKIKSVIPRPISVQVVDREASEAIDLFD